MEIVIVLVIFAGLAYYLFSKHRQMEAEQEPAQYKVEAPTLTETLVAEVAPEPIVEVKVEAPSKPRRQRKPVQKTEAKPTAKPAVKSPKKPAVIQAAAAKAKKPRTPKAK